ncbi:MAG: hypothetical protein WC965_13945 [Thiohalomonadaceae bacterium]
MQRKYTHEQKIQFLRAAYEFVKSEQGTYNDFIYSIGVPRGTYYQWVFKYSDEAGVPVQGRKRPSNQKMVVIGKPQNRGAVLNNHVTVGYYESKIDVHSVDELAMVLQAVKKAATTI